MLCADLDRLSDAQLLWHAPFDDGPLAVHSAATTAPAASDARAALTDALADALATALTARQREVVEMHFYEGLSQGEIARRLGITQQVVQKCLYGAPRGGRLIGGALARLRAALAPLLERAEPTTPPRSPAPCADPSHRAVAG